MFGRICAVCNKQMGNSEHRESYNLGKDDGCHIDVHIKCVKGFEKNPKKYALVLSEESGGKDE